MLVYVLCFQIRKTRKSTNNADFIQNEITDNDNNNSSNSNDNENINNDNKINVAGQNKEEIQNAQIKKYKSNICNHSMYKRVLKSGVVFYQLAVYAPHIIWISEAGTSIVVEDRIATQKFIVCNTPILNASDDVASTEEIDRKKRQQQIETIIIEIPKEIDMSTLDVFPMSQTTNQINFGFVWQNNTNLKHILIKSSINTMKLQLNVTTTRKINRQSYDKLQVLSIYRFEFPTNLKPKVDFVWQGKDCYLTEETLCDIGECYYYYFFLLCFFVFLCAFFV